MLNDILYTVMLVSPLNTMTRLMQVNKYCWNMHESHYFWQNRFREHRLTMYKSLGDLMTYRQLLMEYIRSDHAATKMKTLVKHATRHLHSPYYKLFDTVTLIANAVDTLFILNHIIKTQHFASIDDLTSGYMYFNFHPPRPHILINLYAEHITMDEFYLYYEMQELIDIIKYLVYALPDLHIKTGCGYNFR